MECHVISLVYMLCINNSNCEFDTYGHILYNNCYLNDAWSQLFDIKLNLYYISFSYRLLPYHVYVETSSECIIFNQTVQMYEDSYNIYSITSYYTFITILPPHSP